MTARAAIIIPHYNDTARLGRCLDALVPQLATVPAVEVVVIDNGSTGEHAVALATLAAAHPGLRFVTEPRKGAAEARNRGVAETTAPALIFLDSDCLPAPDWLAAALRAAPMADIVGGRVDVFDETAPPRSGAEAFETVFAFDNRGYVARKGFSVTANLVTRRDVFQATGPFVHGLSEDLDWCRRATARGYRLAYDDAMRVRHPSRQDWAALSRKWRRVNDESFALLGGGAAARGKWALRALAMPLSVVAHTPRILRHPSLDGPGERLRAFATLTRLRLTRMGWMLGQAVRGR